jgi:POT family proton-dependent oligopeptide transporter
MPGHIEDDAIVGAQLHAASAEEEERGVSNEAKQSVSTHDGTLVSQSGVPIAEKNFEALGAGLEDFPTEEDLHTLRRVSDHIPLKLFTIAFIELCERFSYYGTVIVVCSL